MGENICKSVSDKGLILKSTEFPKTQKQSDSKISKGLK
jgi:hypothetical protein